MQGAGHFLRKLAMRVAFVCRAAQTLKHRAARGVREPARPQVLRENHGGMCYMIAFA